MTSPAIISAALRNTDLSTADIRRVLSALRRAPEVVSAIEAETLPPWGPHANGAVRVTHRSDMQGGVIGRVFTLGFPILEFTRPYGASETVFRFLPHPRESREYDRTHGRARRRAAESDYSDALFGALELYDPPGSFDPGFTVRFANGQKGGWVQVGGPDSPRVSMRGVLRKLGVTLPANPWESIDSLVSLLREKGFKLEGSPSSKNGWGEVHRAVA